MTRRRRVVGFYTDRRGRRRPVTARKRAKTIFFPPKSKRYAEIIRIDTPEAAELSVKQMKEEFSKAETDAKKRRLKRMITLAANRAQVISENPRVSSKQREEARRVAEIYRKAAEEMKI